MKLGVNTVLFKPFPVYEAMRLIALSGYDGVELSAIKGMCEHLNLDDPADSMAEIKRAQADFGLELLSMEVASQDEERLVKAFTAAKELGVPVVNVGPTGKMNVEGDLEKNIASLKKLAGIAGEYGVTLCCKAHVGASMFDTDTTLAAMAAIPGASFGIDMDPSHIYRAGEKPEEALPKVISRVQHVHIRDCKGPGPSPGAPRDQACGKGDINLQGYFKAMVDAGYKGPVVLEVIGPDQPIEAATAISAESYGYMNACLVALGAR